MALKKTATKKPRTAAVASRGEAEPGAHTRVSTGEGLVNERTEHLDDDEDVRTVDVLDEAIAEDAVVDPPPAEAKPLRIPEDAIIKKAAFCRPGTHVVNPHTGACTACGKKV